MLSLKDFVIKVSACVSSPCSSVLLNDRTLIFSWLRATVNNDPHLPAFLVLSRHKIAASKVKAEALGGAFQETQGTAGMSLWPFVLCSFLHPGI